ncbi:hypothetical protein [Alicyclobacillus ferrooxydans]|nr:hypothetical protein [Alicyclobacillus ferrooxydans]
MPPHNRADYQIPESIDPKFTSFDQVDEIIHHYGYEAAKSNFDSSTTAS